MHVLTEVSHRTAAPVLKDVQVGLSFVLQEEHRVRGRREECSAVCAVEQLTIWPQHLANQSPQIHTSVDVA